MPKKKVRKDEHDRMIGESPVAPTRTSKADKKRMAENAERRRTLRRKIIARTTAGLEEFSRLIADADMTDLASIPVITGLKPPVVPKKKHKGKPQPVAPLGMPATATADFTQRMAGPTSATLEVGDPAPTAVPAPA